jgi:DNA-binding HxlR family transcriptional regulator
MASRPWLRRPLKWKKFAETTPYTRNTTSYHMQPVVQSLERVTPNRSGGRVRKDHRSECLINRTVEMFGDQWSLLILRDIILMDRRHFRELLTQSLEGIASNILADRLQRLVEQGILVRSQDASHKQKAIYSLTERGIELLPLLLEMAAWGHKHLPAARLRGLAQLLDEGGPKLRAEFMAELRETHLPKSSAKKSSARKKARRPTRSTRIFATQKLQAAYQAALAKRKQ